MLWRLTKGGELPLSLNPDIVVVLIGTNNIPFDPVKSIALGIDVIVSALHDILPNSKILVNEIFPRHDFLMIKTRKENAIGQLNSLLKDMYLDPTNTDLKNFSSIGYLQCGSLFAPLHQKKDNTSYVNTFLVPDKIHPNDVGMKRWLTECVLPPALARIRR